MKVLVVGLERSGTTVIAKLLAKQTGLSLLNDPRDSWYIYPLVRVIGIRGFTYSIVRRIYKYNIVKVPGFASILFSLRRIHILPFKVVYVVRDPRDSYAAIKERLSIDLSGLYLNIEWLGRSGKVPEENIAYRWKEYLNCALKYQGKYPNDIMFIRYEDFLVNKAEYIRRISEYIGSPIISELTELDLNMQVNKGWSDTIKGSTRYLSDLTEREISVIEGITYKEMKRFNYDLCKSH